MVTGRRLAGGVAACILLFGLAGCAGTDAAEPDVEEHLAAQRFTPGPVRGLPPAPALPTAGPAEPVAAPAESAETAGQTAPAQPHGDGAPDGATKVVGTGTAASCTFEALATAVRSGGNISFDCGGAPVTIVVSETLYTCNTTTCDHPWISGEPVTGMTLDGGGLVTLSGSGVRGIFYANACEESFGWLSDSCQNETRPHITFANITFTDGNAQGAPAGFEGVGHGDGGGAIAMRAGTLTVSNATFRNNTCIAADSDGGGGAIRAVGMQTAAVISGSRFEGNRCANGGAISSLHAPLTIVDSQILNNTATGSGASSGSGGNGGGIYFDGTSQDVVVQRTTISGNVAPEGGPGIFYVSNDLTGTLTIDGSTITGNTGQNFYTDPYRSIFYQGSGGIRVTGSTIE